MLKYNPEGAEFATKEILAQAIAHEVLEGRGTKRGGVYSDLSHLPWENPSVQSDMADLIEHGKQFGFDPHRGPVEIWPLAHTPTGGIKVDENGESGVSGLFAVGASAASMYGFGRIEGFTSLITQVFGKRAGEAAAKKGPSNKAIPGSALEQERGRVFSFLGAQGISPSLVLDRLHAAMYKHGWILKNEEGLQAGLKEVIELRKLSLGVSSDHRSLNGEWVRALELSNMLLLAELVLRGSLMRKESRGSFFRLDYPNTDNQTWMAHITFSQRDGRTETSVEKVAR
jgi:fumarate reductase (CoM/CoB) subunit A